MISFARGLHHVAIQVHDLEGVAAFYRDMLGLIELKRWPSHNGQGDRSIWLDTGDGSFLAIERIESSDAPTASDPWRTTLPGLHLVALRIDAAMREAVELRLVALGVELPHRTAFTLYVRDPEGNRVGLSHYPTAADDGGGAGSS